MTSTVAHTRPVRHLPEPGRFWIASAPRSWRYAGELWTDLANARLSVARGKQETSLPEIEIDDVEDLLYIPPVAKKLTKARDLLVTKLAEQDVPLLVQLAPGGKAKVPDGVTRIYDLLNPLLKGDIDQLGRLPADAIAVWPLISGITDRPEMWEEGCAVLAATKVSCVQAVVVDIPPPLRRRLAENRDEEVFDALFHGQTPSERRLSQMILEYGMEPFAPRPETGSTPRQRRNRKIAASLALAGELWIRLGRPANAGQAFFRAARGAESIHHDLTALAREGNLGVLDWLDARCLEVVTELVEEETSTLLGELRTEYLET